MKIKLEIYSEINAYIADRRREKQEWPNLHSLKFESDAEIEFDV